jgi:predicted DNA-binding transcriptional regulator AlpA
MTVRNFEKARRKDQARAAARELRETEWLQQEIKIASLKLLTVEEIRRRLAWIKAIDKNERNARRYIGLNTISVMTGYGRDYLYKIINGQSFPTPRARQKLSAVLQQIEMPNLYLGN